MFTRRGRWAKEEDDDHNRVRREQAEGTVYKVRAVDRRSSARWVPEDCDGYK